MDKTLKALRENWRNELLAADMYRALARSESDAQRRRLLEQMSLAEEEHADLWRRKVEEAGGTVEEASLRRARRWNARLVRWLGKEAVLRRIEKEEQGHVLNYGSQLRQLDDPSINELLERIIPEEREHAERLHVMAGNPPAGHSPHSRLESILRRERWHVSSGSWIGDAIYGANDGLGAVFGIVSGVAGATGGGHLVLVSGLAGMIASALSMGSGAYLAAKSEREVFEAELERERQEIELDPEHEREELALIYQLQGFSEQESRDLAARIASRPNQFLRTMAHEELGLSSELLPNPWIALLSSTTSTALGAGIPLIPFFFTQGVPAIIGSGIISLVAHFAVGAAKCLVTNRSWLASGTEMTVVGIIEAVAAYGIGVLIAPAAH
ncbi:MAG: VIT1/CCC1 transporter family protein [Armatimonadetes bacterium]|nr:VIT1/CCC1 transporter family protein [Armatimonadota bacterium]